MDIVERNAGPTMRGQSWKRVAYGARIVERKNTYCRTIVRVNENRNDRVSIRANCAESAQKKTAAAMAHPLGRCAAVDA